MIIEVSEFKRQPILVFKKHENDKYPFSFGLEKAKTILAHVEDIKKFVESGGTVAASTDGERYPDPKWGDPPSRPRAIDPIPPKHGDDDDDIPF